MPKPTDQGDSFLGRWSRNKRAQPAAPAPVADPDPSADIAAPDQESLTEEEIAALPDVDDLTPQSDIRVFLQKGVPQVLRNAALRRKWMLVPGIRDHNDPAVDYAWDWNTPGGVPGDGAAPSPERAAQMLRDLFAPRRDAETTQTAETEADAADPATVPAKDIALQQTDLALTQPQVTQDKAEAKGSAASQDQQQQAAGPDSDAVPARRRHGGALPG